MANARKFSMMSFDEIRNHLRSILAAKGGALADFGEASYGRLMIELFAGDADLMANYVESAFENSFLESAHNTQSTYANSRMLGYSIRRPVPAKAGIGVRTTKTGVYDTIRVFIPKGTEFTLGSVPLTAVDDIVFSYDRELDIAKTGLMTHISGRAVLAQGTVRTESLVSNGTQNQTFIINDSSFSDYFGDNDPNYADDGNVSHRAAGFTTVTSDATLVDNIDLNSVMDDRLYWRISRRGFTDPARENTINDLDKFIEGQDNYTTNYTAIINTNNAGTVQLKFGDGVKSAIPYGVLTVKYFSTYGEMGNMSNVAGTVLSSNGSMITITQADGTESDITVNDLNIALTTDIRGGQNIETMDSIKNNASAIYSTLDRLVNRLSYKIFLRRYADIKYATAYGEDILNTKLLNGGINVKYMNQIRFSVLKDLYRERDGVYYPTTANEYFLDGYKINGLMYTWEYDYEDVDITGNGYDGEKVAIINRISDTLHNAVSNGTLTDGCSFDDDAAVDKFIATYLSALIPDMKLDYKVFSANLTPMDFVEDGSELHSIMVALNQRGMLTVGNGYHSFVYPTVHNVQLKMDVTLFKGNNFTDIRERIKNEVYKYLKDNTEFSTPIYRSKIESIVHKMVEVAGVDVFFEPVDDGYRELDMGKLEFLGDLTYDYIKPGSVTDGPFTFYLQYDVVDGNTSDTHQDAFTILGNSGTNPIQKNISQYYTFNVQPKLSKGTLTDVDIDHFTAHIWQQLMQQIYTPVFNTMQDARSSGEIARATYLYSLLNAIKGWDMGSSSLTFKDTDVIHNMVEYNGSSLYNYMRYGIEYIKLVRNVLSYYVTSGLIDENGNITKYSNDNEIVQITIPSDLINLTVAYESSLLTDKDA